MLNFEYSFISSLLPIQYTLLWRFWQGHLQEGFFDCIVDHGQFEIINQDSGPGQPDREEHGAGPFERGNYERVSNPKQMHPLRVEKKQKPDIFPGKTFSQLVYIYQGCADDCWNFSVIYKYQEGLPNFAGIEKTHPEKAQSDHVRGQPIKMQELPDKKPRSYADI
jgi:hypothetical protein